MIAGGSHICRSATMVYKSSTMDQSYKKCHTLTKTFVQKLYKIYTKLYKTLNFYIFCIQKLYKSKFCMIMYKKCTSNSYIYTKNVQTVKNLYKVPTKNGSKLEMLCFLYIHTMCKLYKIYTNVNCVI